MKNILFLMVVFIIVCDLKAQTVLDTRETNEAPTFYDREVKYEFKKRSVIGVPGAGYYSGLMTFAPWRDNSGGEHHQLNFNKGGVFYRSGLPDNTSWNNWSQLLTINSGGNVGIGTNSPFQKLSIKGGRPRFALVDSNGDAGVIEFYEVSNQIRFQKWYNSGNTYDKTIMVLNGNDGKVGIGTTNPDMQLTVKGKIHAEEVKVDLNIPVPDYVFENNYKLRSIESTEQFIKENKHLPEIPSAKEFKKNGMLLAEMDMSLLKKIEELTLYTIQQEKKIVKQAQKIENLELLNQKFVELQSRLDKLEIKK